MEDNCETLISVKIPDSVTTIERRAFEKCSLLSNVTIPASVTEIGELAFESCRSLTSVSIPRGVTIIGESTFSECEKLLNVTLPDSLEKIGPWAFAGCENLTKIDIPDSVTEIGSLAFYDCFRLKSLSLPPNVKTIENQLFVNCRELKTLFIPISVTTIESYAFFSSESLSDIYYPGTRAQWDEISVDENNDHLLKATIHYNSITPTPDTQESYSVSFDSCGGIVSPTSKTVVKGKSYGVLPSPTRSGYIFDGWYTAASGGAKIESTTTVTASANHKLFAHWTPGQFTVSFDANGGAISTHAKAVVYGSTYGDLPTPKLRENYTFVGWYTAPQKGEIITPSSVVQIEDDQILYAHWVAIERFSFLNSSYDYFISGRGKYRINGKYLIALQSGLSSAEWKDVENHMLSNWWGSCFGMSALFLLRCNERINPEPFQSGAEKLDDFRKPKDDSTIFNLINYYHLQQMRPETSGVKFIDGGRGANACYYNRNLLRSGKYNEYLIEDLKNGPSMICFLQSYGGGHCVVGLGVEQDTNGEYRIPVWDPNDNTSYETLIISEDYMNSHFVSGNYPGVQVKSSIPLSIAKDSYDHLNIQNYIYPSYSSRYSSGPITRNTTDSYVEISTSFDSFTVMDANEKIAVFESGEYVPGKSTLPEPLICEFNYTNPDQIEDNTNRYAFPYSSTYSVVPKNATEKGTGAVLFDDYYVEIESDGMADGFTVTHEGQVSVSNNGEPAKQIISITSDNFGTKRNSISIAGTDTGITITSAEGEVFVRPENAITAKTVLSNVFTKEEDNSKNLKITTSGYKISLDSKDDSGSGGNSGGSSSGSNSGGSTTVGNSSGGSTSGGSSGGSSSGSSGGSSDGGSSSSAASKGPHIEVVNPQGGMVKGFYYGTVEIQVNAGWQIASVTVNGNGVTVPTDGKLIGLKSTDNVVVTFESLNPKPSSQDNTPSAAPIQPQKRFLDVPIDAYYFDAVEWAVKKKVTKGEGKKKFNPNAPCTRAEMLTFLWRVCGSPEPWGGGKRFNDIPAGSYYEKAVQWAGDMKIVKGEGGNRFNPSAPITRGEALTFIYRAKASPTASIGTKFMDVSSDAYYSSAVYWAVEKGVAKGVGGKKFNPNAPCTRAQVITFLYRAYQ